MDVTYNPLNHKENERLLIELAEVIAYFEHDYDTIIGLTLNFDDGNEIIAEFEWNGEKFEKV